MCFCLYTSFFYSIDVGLCEVNAGSERAMLVFPGLKCGSIQLVVSIELLNFMSVNKVGS